MRPQKTYTSIPKVYKKTAYTLFPITLLLNTIFKHDPPFIQMISRALYICYNHSQIRISFDDPNILTSYIILSSPSTLSHSRLVLSYISKALESMRIVNAKDNIIHVQHATDIHYPHPIIKRPPGVFLNPLTSTLKTVNCLFMYKYLSKYVLTFLHKKLYLSMKGADE